MERETIDLVNLANQLAHTLNEPPKSKTAKVLNFQFWQMKGPYAKPRVS